MKKVSTVLIFTGATLTTISLIALFLIFYPVLRLEIEYLLQGPGKQTISLTNTGSENVLVPVDREFSIVIPKIRANAKVIPNVNPYDEREYQWALTRGVAHAKGTVLPGEVGNIFLFSHSSVNFYNAARYNSIFYLLDKLQNNDEIYIFYKGGEYKYKVVEKKIVDAEAVSYLNPIIKTKQLTLMTCWPPGTTLKRLLVTAQ